MKNIDYKVIENKHKKLLSLAKEYMISIKDFEHDVNHMNDVVYYTKKLIDELDIEIDPEVCIISAYWHDVGRTKLGLGHEKLSADMLKEIMIQMGYDEILIEKCYKAIENHKWNMTPETNEGLVVKDADKLAFLGLGRWNACLNHNQRLDSIIELLPRLKNDFLYFSESKKMYDEEIVKLLAFLYNNYYNTSIKNIDYVSLEEYKNYLVNVSKSNYDKTLEKKQDRIEKLNKNYGDELLNKIIEDTYEFAKELVDCETIKSDYCEIELEDDKTFDISLGLVGGRFSDKIYVLDGEKYVSNYIIHKIFGDYFSINLACDEIPFNSGDDIYGINCFYRLHIQNFPDNLDEIKEQLFSKKEKVKK